MTRLAVLLDARARGLAPAALRRRLRSTPDLAFELVPGALSRRRSLDPSRFDGALLPLEAGTSARSVAAARRALPGRPIGGLAIAPDARALRRIARLPLDFVVEAWRPTDPAPEAVRAHLALAARPARARGAAAVHTSARRLAILTDVVKTANSILEPR